MKNLKNYYVDVERLGAMQRSELLMNTGQLLADMLHKLLNTDTLSETQATVIVNTLIKYNILLVLDKMTEPIEDESVHSFFGIDRRTEVINELHEINDFYEEGEIVEPEA